MKSTINRFLVISVVLITALAFMNGDCQQAAQATPVSDEAVTQNDAELVVVTEAELNTTEKE